MAKTDFHDPRPKTERNKIGHSGTETRLKCTHEFRPILQAQGLHKAPNDHFVLRLNKAFLSSSEQIRIVSVARHDNRRATTSATSVHETFLFFVLFFKTKKIPRLMCAYLPRERGEIANSVGTRCYTRFKIVVFIQCLGSSVNHTHGTYAYIIFGGNYLRGPVSNTFFVFFFAFFFTDGHGIRSVCRNRGQGFTRVVRSGKKKKIAY